MREDMESLWQAMKGSHYDRTIKNLRSSISRTNNLQEALSIALETAAKAIHAETGTLWIHEHYDSDKIHPRAVYGGSDLSGVWLRPGEGIVGQVIKTKQSVIIKDCQSDPRWASRVDAKTGFVTRSMVCVPLYWDDICFGSIQIINHLSGQLFDEKDLSLAEQLATEITFLLKEQGLLEKFLTPDPDVLHTTLDFTFRELFLQGTAKEMEQRLKRIPEFSELSYYRKQEVLQISNKIRNIFAAYRR